MAWIIRLSIVVWIAGCAGVAPKKPLPLALPFHKQPVAHLCGVAALQMLADYYKHPLPQAQVASLSQEAKNKEGLSGASMKAALESLGFFAVVFPGTVTGGETSLQRQLELKRPLIVMLGRGPRHYVVVTGYDPTHSKISLMDPLEGALTLPQSAFLASWNEANAFTLLSFPR